eukprot:2825530-Amphidinium_carterae.1
MVWEHCGCGYPLADRVSLVSIQIQGNLVGRPTASTSLPAHMVIGATNTRRAGCVGFCGWQECACSTSDSLPLSKAKRSLYDCRIFFRAKA